MVVYIKEVILFIFSPCSGLIVTSFTKYAPDDSFETNMLKAIEQYKSFKKMYIVDNSAAKYEGKVKGI